MHCELIRTGDQAILDRLGLITQATEPVRVVFILCTPQYHQQQQQQQQQLGTKLLQYYFAAARFSKHNYVRANQDYSGNTISDVSRILAIMSACLGQCSAVNESAIYGHSIQFNHEFAGKAISELDIDQYKNYNNVPHWLLNNIFAVLYVLFSVLALQPCINFKVFYINLIKRQGTNWPPTFQ